MKNIFSLFFVPQLENNWKGKILHHDFLTVLIMALLVLNIGFKLLLGNAPSHILGVNTSLSIEELLNNTNAERIKLGFKPLSLSAQLSGAAKQKAADMFVKDYWAHFSPDGTSPWYFFEKAHYKYVYAGENLAKDFTTSQSAVNAWMNSEKHRENLLKPEYREVGFAISEGMLLGAHTTLIVQFFGTPDTSFSASESQSEIRQIPSTSTSITQLVKSERIEKKYLIDAGLLQKRIIFLILSFLIVAFSIDLYVLERKNISRVSGMHVAHFALIIFFIIGMLIVKPGVIL